MAKLSAKTCEAAKPLARGVSAFSATETDSFFLRIRPNGTRTWVVEYVFESRRRKYTIGIYDSGGSPGESITAWLEHGRISLGQARSIAAEWKADRRVARDPIAEWEANIAAKQAQLEAAIRTAKVESEQPTVRGAIEQFLSKHIEGKKSAAATKYRLDRLIESLGSRKIRDVTRQDAIAALEKIAKGRIEGRTAKQLAGEVLIQAKRVWRYRPTPRYISIISFASTTTPQMPTPAPFFGSWTKCSPEVGRTFRSMLSARGSMPQLM